MEYLPFGETLVDEHLNSRNSPFKYNGKEFDEETGNYYYGARYYDPKWSIFVSVDPLAEKTMSSYGYCYQNPINLIDPTGMEGESNDDWIKNKQTNTMEFHADITEINTPEGYKHMGESYTHRRADGYDSYYLKGGGEFHANINEVYIESSYQKPFTIGESGIYGPYIPDAIGASGHFSANGFFGHFSLDLAFAIDNKNNFKLYGGGTADFGLQYALPGFKGGMTLDLHDIYGDYSKGVLNGIEGYSSGYYVSPILGFGQTWSTDYVNGEFSIAPSGVRTTSFSLGTSVGLGTTLSKSNILFPIPE